ncbi:unnamed protein product, partial [Trichogramma brassicae]
MFDPRGINVRSSRNPCMIHVESAWMIHVDIHAIFFNWAYTYIYLFMSLRALFYYLERQNIVDFETPQINTTDELASESLGDHPSSGSWICSKIFLGSPAREYHEIHSFSGLFTSCLHNTSKRHCKYHLYADDFTIFASGPVSNAVVIVSRVNEDLARISAWTAANRPSINVRKTQAAWFGSHGYIARMRPTLTPPLLLDGETADVGDTIRLLGIVLNASLSWRVEVIATCRTWTIEPDYWPTRDNKYRRRRDYLALCLLASTLWRGGPAYLANYLSFVPRDAPGSLRRSRFELKIRCDPFLRRIDLRIAPKITLGTTQIEYSTEVKCLGVWIQSKLDWSKQVDTVVAKVFGALRCLRHFRHALTMQNLPYEINFSSPWIFCHPSAASFNIIHEDLLQVPQSACRDVLECVCVLRYVIAADQHSAVCCDSLCFVALPLSAASRYVDSTVAQDQAPPPWLAEFAGSIRTQLEAHAREFKEMKTHLHGKLEEIRSQAEAQHIELSSKLAQFESSITQLTARVEAQEHKSAESATALAKMQNEIEELDMSSPAIFQAEIERVLKYVDMTNDKMLDKMFEMMNRLMNKVEGLCTSVRELDLRVSEQEAKSSAPVSPIKEDLENAPPPWLAEFAGSIRTQLEAHAREFKEMKTHLHGKLEEIRSQAEAQHIELSSKLAQFESSITQLTARVEAQEHKSAESATALAKMQNEIEEVKENALKVNAESISAIRQELLHVTKTVQNIQTADCSPAPQHPQHLTDDCEVLLSGLPLESTLTGSAILDKTLSNIGLTQHTRFITRTRGWSPKNQRKNPNSGHTRSLVFQCSSPVVRDTIISHSHKLSNIRTQSLFNTDREALRYTPENWKNKAIMFSRIRATGARAAAEFESSLGFKGNKCFLKIWLHTLTKHTNHWGSQEQQEEALRQRRVLDLELCNGDTGLLPPSRVNTSTSMLARNQWPSTCLLRGNPALRRYPQRTVPDLTPRGRKRGTCVLLLPATMNEVLWSCFVQSGIERTYYPFGFRMHILEIQINCANAYSSETFHINEILTSTFRLAVYGQPSKVKLQTSHNVIVR